MDKSLLMVARNAILSELDQKVNKLIIKDEWLKNGASFVTLTQNDSLRGCIGSLEAIRPLYIDISENAVAAAFRDPRFSALTIDDLKTVKIEISILSSLNPIFFKNEEEILKKIIPNKMGLLLEYGLYRGTFLPQVWDYYPTPQLFFNHLKLKAGLKEDFFNRAIKLYSYEVEKCQE